jgi:hypothetical protein
MSLIHRSYLPYLLFVAATALAWPRAVAAEPATTYSWGGYVKLDGIYSSNTRGRPSDVADYLLAPGLITVPTSETDAAFNFTARESRVWFKTSTETDLGNLDTHIEIDFLGFDANLGSELTTTSSSLRLRHAYGTWNGLLVGQTWTTWMDLDALPETNDFGSPAGRVFARQAQARYTLPLAAIAGQLQVAIENPEASLTEPAGTQVVPTDDYMPDTVVKVSTAGSWGHVAAAGIVRMLRSNGALTGAETAKDTQLGVGGRVSGKLMLGARHNLRFDGTAGRGIGRYVGLNGIRDGEIDAQGDIKPINVLATILAGQVWLTDTVRINLAGSMSQALNNSDALTGLVNERLISVHSNVMWNPIPRIRLGIEYIFASRALEGGPTGKLHRGQASAQYLF